MPAGAPGAKGQEVWGGTVEGGCVCVWVYVCYGCVCVEMKEWKKSIPENKRRKAWATKFMPHLSNRQCVIIKGFERKIL